MQQKQVYIKTYGCQMNVYDSEKMTDLLGTLGYRVCEHPSEADMMILNTCHIREKATEKVYSELGRLRIVQQARRNRGLEAFLVVAGCVAQAEGEVILKRAPYVDFILGPQSYQALPELLEKKRSNQILSRSPAGVALEFDAEDKFEKLTTISPFQESRVSAFLSIQEGCDKFCTFCCVPFTRGAEFSRSAQSIIEEAHTLVNAGVRDITLLGQNVNAYHGLGLKGKEWSLGHLLQALSDIPDLWRLRYTTSHPINVDNALIAAHRDLPKVMPFLHLPVQSGSDRILKAMNRHHNRAYYLKTLASLIEAQPNLAFSSDFIVGFPGETDSDFEDTLSLIAEMNQMGAYLAQAFSFSYSPRPGTVAAPNDNVPPVIKAERLQRLQEVIQVSQQQFNQRSLHAKMPVLFEKAGRHMHQWIGRTPHMQSVHVYSDAESLVGQMRCVTIDGLGPNSLSGTLET